MKTLALILTLGVVALSGCYLELEENTHPGGLYDADLKVTWRIDGSQSTGYCDSYGIAQWEVEVRGPDPRTIHVDCRAHYWSSESDFYNLLEGNYSVIVRALDSADYVLAEQRSSLSLVDSGFVETLSFQFYPSDF